MKVIILIGPPGSGKDTQAHLLSQATGWSIISSQQIIRQKIASAPNDPSLDAAKGQYARGDLVDPALVGKWTVERLQNMLAASADRDINVIMSGTTRSMIEVGIVVPFLVNRFGHDNVTALYIDISTDEALRRNSQRRICDRCQRPVLPSTPENVAACPYEGCGGRIVRRDLDKPELLMKRQQVYQRDTAPVPQYLKDQGLLIHINGEQSIADVHQEIMTSLGLTQENAKSA